MSNTKICAMCKQEFPRSEFARDPRFSNSANAYCKECDRTYQREWRRKNKDRVNARIRERYQKDKTAMREPTQRYKVKLREECIAAYGGKCACCGESALEFLCIDHVNGGGNAHRKTLAGKSIHLWLKERGYPKDDFRVLCQNCNMAYAHYGYCPHQQQASPSK